MLRNFSSKKKQAVERIEIVSNSYHRKMVKTEVKNNSRLSDLIHYRLRVITQDGKVYIGELMAFDKHMNMVLNDCVEERIPKTQLSKLQSKQGGEGLKVEKRILGLTILRGGQILTTVVEDKPAMSKKERLSSAKKHEKELQRQKNQRKSKNQKQDPKTANKVTKPAVGNTKMNDDIQRRKFQPPPGFKRR